MTKAEYEAYLARLKRSRTNGEAAGTPRHALRVQGSTKWSAPETRYFQGVLGGSGAYEPETIRITPDRCEKHSYTPDFGTVVGGLKVYHEVKGEYRLGSQDGARLRWCFAALARPDAVFVWAKELRTRRWDIDVWLDGGRTRLKGHRVLGFDIDHKGGVTWRK